MFDELLNAGQRAGEWAGRDGNGQILALLGANLMQGGARGMSTTQGLGQALQMGIMANAQQEAFRRAQAAQAVKAQQDAESHQAQMALSGARTRSAEVNTQRDLQGMESEKKQEPLKIQKLEAEVKGAKTKADVDAIRLRLLEVEASPEGMKNSQRLQQLKLDLEQRKIETEKAQAGAYGATADERKARAEQARKETSILEKTGMKPGSAGGGKGGAEYDRFLEAYPDLTPSERAQKYLEWKKTSSSKSDEASRRAHLEKMQQAGIAGAELEAAMRDYDAFYGRQDAPAEVPAAAAGKPAKKATAKDIVSLMDQERDKAKRENRAPRTREQLIELLRSGGYDLSEVDPSADRKAVGKIGEKK